jgi:senataxin
MFADFKQVFDCFRFLIRRIGKAIWDGESREFPLTFFDTLKRNPSFEELFRTVETSTQRSLYITWFQEFLFTVREHGTYGDILVKTVDYLFEKGKEGQPLFIECATNVRISN